MRQQWVEERRRAFNKIPDGFPNLLRTGFTIDDVTSRRGIHYNCVAFAAKDETQPWWPLPDDFGIRYYHWPEGLPREYTPTAGNFLRAFETLGYKQCRDGDKEWGFEKVAIYVNADDVPTHMARELGDGVWYSKLGNEQDIRHHTLSALDNPVYGQAKYFMRKPLERYPRWKRAVGRIRRFLVRLKNRKGR